MKSKFLEPGRYAARVQFLQIKEDLFELLQDGYSLAAIFRFFQSEDKCSMSYQTFCRYIKKLRSKELNQKHYQHKFNQAPSSTLKITDKPISIPNSSAISSGSPNILTSEKQGKISTDFPPNSIF